MPARAHVTVQRVHGHVLLFLFFFVFFLHAFFRLLKSVESPKIPQRRDRGKTASDSTSPSGGALSSQRLLANAVWAAIASICPQLRAALRRGAGESPATGELLQESLRLLPPAAANFCSENGEAATPRPLELGVNGATLALGRLP